MIRNVQGATKEEVQAALAGLDLFINYFGLQRFGMEDVPTHRYRAIVDATHTHQKHATH